MTNRSSSKQHGLTMINITRPKAKLRKRKNKSLANERKAARRELLTESGVA